MADLHKAIISLYDNVVSVEGKNSDDIVAKYQDGSVVDIDWTQVNAWTDSEQYKYERKNEYPDIGDQLDDLFKAGAFSTEMTATIQAVKDKYPKE